jgi:hypothetical protein
MRRRAATLALLLAAPAWAAPYPVVSVPVYRLTCRVLVAAGGASDLVAEAAAELDPSRAGRLEAAVPWEGGPARLVLDAIRLDAGDGTHRLELQAELTPPGPGPRTRVARTLELPEGGTGLVELHRRPGRTLVLALTVETGQRAVVRAPDGRGVPVTFRVAVSRVAGAQEIPLETNALHTLVGEGVEYAFRRGTGAEEERVLLRITPVRLDGDVAELDVALTGRLPGESGAQPIERTRRLVATRGSTTSFDALAGAAGYRFRITPQF